MLAAASAVDRGGHALTTASASLTGWLGRTESLN
jgi:hypothetical protein